MREFTTDDKIEALHRELKLRQSAYPRWVREGRMTQDNATKQIEIMKSILADYQKQIQKELL